MSGLYGSRATKFLISRRRGHDGCLMGRSQRARARLSCWPRSSCRKDRRVPCVVQSGLLNEMITLEGSRPARLRLRRILSCQTTPTPWPPHLSAWFTTGDFGDIVGQKATIHHAMTLADSWKTIPGELLLQFSGTLKTARGGTSGVREGTIVREMSRSTGETENNAQIRARYVDMGPASDRRIHRGVSRRGNPFQGSREAHGGPHARGLRDHEPNCAQRGQLRHQYRRGWLHRRAGRILGRNEWDGQTIRWSDLRFWWIWECRKIPA